MDKKERVAAENKKPDKDVDKNIMELLSTFTPEQLIKALEIVLDIANSE